MSIGGAFKAFFAVLGGADFIDKSALDEAVSKAKSESESKVKELEEALTAQKKAAEASSKRDRFAEGAVYTLVLLQREGRLIDFLMEDISAYSNEQIGTAVRNIHSGSAKVLKENFAVKPVSDKAENSSVEIADDFDPYSYKLSGNVPDKGPYKGTLRHKGWLSGNTSFSKRSDEVNPDIIQAAELEI